MTPPKKRDPYADWIVAYVEETSGARAENVAREVNTGQVNPEDE